MNALQHMALADPHSTPACPACRPAAVSCHAAPKLGIGRHCRRIATCLGTVQRDTTTLLDYGLLLHYSCIDTDYEYYVLRKPTDSVAPDSNADIAADSRLPGCPIPRKRVRHSRPVNQTKANNHT